MDDLSQRKLLSATCHGAIFFSLAVVLISIPIAILLTSEDPIVKENAKESINFQINLYLYAVVVLSIVMAIGEPLLIVLAIVSILFTLTTASLLLPLIAIERVITKPQTPYRYRSILRLL